MYKTFLRLSLLIAALCIGSFSSAAADLGQIVLGKTYAIPQYQELSGTITAPASGKLYQKGGDAFVYTDVASGKTISPTSAGYCDNGQMWALNVEKDKTYTVYCDFVFNAANVVWEMEGTTAFTFTRSNPAQGSTVTTSVNSSGDILVTMSEPFSFTTASVSAGGTSVTIASEDIPMRRSPQITQAVRIANALRQLYTLGAINEKGGSTIEVKVEGIASAGNTTYGTDGSLTLNFVAGPKPMEMISTTVDQMAGIFKSYYPEGSEEGRFECVFSDNINTSKPVTATFTIGDVSNPAGHVVEDIPVVIDGNKIIVDVTGVNRRPAIAAAGLTTEELCSIKISGIYDPTGSPCEGNGQGLLASVAFSFQYFEVLERPITYQFTPDNGDFLTNESQIELWYNNSDVIQSFDGILFSYDDGDSYLIPSASLQNISEEPGEVVYVFDIPQKAKTAEVEVSLANIVSNDGYDKIVKAAYNKFVVTYSYPFTEGATMDMIPADPFLTDDDAGIEDKLVHIRTNFSDRYPELFVWYKVTDTTLNRFIHGTYMTPLEDGEFAGAWLPNDYKLVAGHTYTATFYAWDSESAAYADLETCRFALGSHTVTFFGSNAGFMYSPTVFESISPDPNMGPINPDQNVLTITYDGVVKINEQLSGIPIGMGVGTLKFSKIEAVDPDPENNGFASSWKLTVPASVMAGQSFEANIAAFDMNNLPVQGDMETYDNNDYKSFSYTIKSAAYLRPIITTPADSQTLYSIKSIKIENESLPIGIEWNCTQPIQIADESGKVLHTVVKSDNAETNEVEIITIDDDEDASYCCIELNTPITAPGTYTVTIPEGYFTLGSQFTTYSNEETTLTLTVTDLIGDVDANGEIASADLGTLVNIICGLDSNLPTADIDIDNSVTSTDLGLLVNIICGL